MAGVGKQIFGSFEDIGKDVAREVVKAPSDIFGSALESFGTGKVSKTTQNPQQKDAHASSQASDGALHELDTTTDMQTKKAIARAALSQIAHKPKQKEPTIWEKTQEDLKQQKEFESIQKKKQSMDTLPVIRGARRRGDLFGVNAKKQGSEIGKNVRQD